MEVYGDSFDQSSDNGTGVLNVCSSLGDFGVMTETGDC
jgi:hypothetical protein